MANDHAQFVSVRVGDALTEIRSAHEGSLRISCTERVLMVSGIVGSLRYQAILLTCFKDLFADSGCLDRLVVHRADGFFQVSKRNVYLKKWLRRGKIHRVR